MQKYKTFIVFLVLISLWAVFFSAVKFFLWGDLANSDIEPNLQLIAGYLSIGSFFSYIIGGALAYTFLEKHLIFSVSFFSFVFISLGYIFGFESNLFFMFILVFIGFFYGLWSVIKNILISIEIKKTGLPDTMVNAYVSSIFIFFIILGSIVGNLLYETIGHMGYIYIIIIPLIISIVSLLIDYEKITLKSLLQSGYKSYFFDRRHKFVVSIKEYFPNMIYIIKKYYVIILTSSFLWSGSAVISQQALLYSVENFSTQASIASFIFLFSALGLMFGNILSIRMKKFRWHFFIFSTMFFAGLIMSFPIFASSFLNVCFIIFVSGIFFGVSSNLIDSYYFLRIGDEYKKEFGSSAYGLIFSMVIFTMMFLSIYINDAYGLNILTILVSSFIVLFGFLAYSTAKRKRKIIYLKNRIY